MLRLRISSDSDAARSLISASRCAQALGFTRQDGQAISTAVSELAKNILKYAGNGEIIIEQIQVENRTAFQITASDQGPGIEDLDAGIRDHCNASDTMESGLARVKRLMDELEIDSAPGKGTRVVIRKWRESSR